MSKRRRGPRSVMGSRTYANLHKTVIVKYVDPALLKDAPPDPTIGDDVPGITTKAPQRAPKKALRLDKVTPD